MFVYTAGFTKDLRAHTHLFVLAKDTNWKVGMAER
jgi:hypothetical protein